MFLRLYQFGEQIASSGFLTRRTGKSTLLLQLSFLQRLCMYIIGSSNNLENTIGKDYNFYGWP